MATKKIVKKNIEYYLNLPWTYTIETAHEKGKTFYVIHVNELPGICTDALTVEKAMSLIKEPMRGLFEMYLENNEPIPEPIDTRTYRGKIAYRTTNTRHSLIAKEAKRKKLSLSTIIDRCIDQTLNPTRSR